MSFVAEIDPPSGTLVRFVSDLHLGNPRSSAPRLAEFSHLLYGADMLVLCGDTAETHPVCMYRTQAEALRREIRDLSVQRGVRLVELAGNHDPDIELQMVRMWQGKVVAMHGHALLRGVAPWSREFFRCEEAIRSLQERVSPSASTENQLLLAREISMLLGEERARASGRSPVRPSLLQELHYCFWPPIRPLRVLQAWGSCARLAEIWCRHREPAARLFIFGHFHRGFIRHRRDLTLVNTGAWFTHATPYIVDVCDARLVRCVSLNRFCSHG